MYSPNSNSNLSQKVMRFCQNFGGRSTGGFMSHLLWWSCLILPGYPLLTLLPSMAQSKWQPLQQCSSFTSPLKNTTLYSTRTFRCLCPLTKSELVASRVYVGKSKAGRVEKIKVWVTWSRQRFGRTSEKTGRVLYLLIFISIYLTRKFKTYLVVGGKTQNIMRFGTVYSPSTLGRAQS